MKISMKMNVIMFDGVKMGRIKPDKVDLEIARRGKLSKSYFSDPDFRNSEFYRVHREIYEGL